MGAILMLLYSSSTAHHVLQWTWSTRTTQNTIAATVNLTRTRHTISDSANKFTVIHKGCDKRERKDNTYSWCNWAEVVAVKHGIQSGRLVKHASKEGNGMLSSGNDGI
ncbi:PREDICTED: wall-associated receptor kinase [Prunus dulcis]|uniref:PREDICTED: wall-associated receptor kinase n=1 Tax=Prunus dulcis TaxID=3755 RepID=A0A5E4E856_PRUDU|nr:hypothetical protein L3X38_015214 [Prunus dulcis]VVA11466.1 PREDICTED: wall-associated receptor kinase [Prunus dulcis]